MEGGGFHTSVRGTMFFGSGTVTRGLSREYDFTSPSLFRERRMRTKFFCTNFLNTASDPGHPGKIPGTSRIPLFETQGRQSFEGGHEVFGHHPFAWKTPTPPGGLRTQKLNLCALFSCLIVKGQPESAEELRDNTVAARKVQSVPVLSFWGTCKYPSLRVGPPFESVRSSKGVNRA